MARLWATSDLHVENAINWAWLSGMPEIFSEDGLLVAGDVCTSLELLRSTFRMLRSKFKAVFYCVGNHELWLQRQDGVDDSVEKLFAILQMASVEGVHAVPVLLGDDDVSEPVAVVPLHSWYHADFLSPEMESSALEWEQKMRREHAGESKSMRDEVGQELLKESEERRRRRKEKFQNMDGACVWPRCLDAAPPSRELATFFARLNEGSMERALSLCATRAGGSGKRQRKLLTFSHFLPLPRLHRGPMLLGDIEGSLPLGEQITRLRPDCHIFGHTHWQVRQASAPNLCLFAWCVRGFLAMSLSLVASRAGGHNHQGHALHPAPLGQPTRAHGAEISQHPNGKPGFC